MVRIDTTHVSAGAFSLVVHKVTVDAVADKSEEESVAERCVDIRHVNVAEEVLSYK